MLSLLQINHILIHTISFIHIVFPHDLFTSEEAYLEKKRKEKLGGEMHA